VAGKVDHENATGRRLPKRPFHRRGDPVAGRLCAGIVVDPAPGNLVARLREHLVHPSDVRRDDIRNRREEIVVAGWHSNEQGGAVRHVHLPWSLD
jgi:hypothetical protein